MARETMLGTPTANARKPSLGQLWQVPTFLASLLAALSLWLAHPFWQADGARRVDEVLATARQLLDVPQVPLERVRALVEDAFRRSNEAPQRVGEAHFLLGSAYLHAAEACPAEQMAEWRRKARFHLEQADLLGLPLGDRNRLMYRLGKASYWTGVEPRRVIELLSGTVEQAADDRAEGYAMLTQAYLRLPVPDLQAALDANGKQLAQPTILDTAVTRARLLRGELFLRLGRPEDAHKALARIGPGAPRSILAQARQLRARQYQETGAWQNAATLWKEILAEQQAAPLAPGRILYDLGLCNQHLGHPLEAAHDWGEAMRQGGDAGQAAALRLAHLRLKNNSDPATVLPLYEQALQQVIQPADYRNTLLELAEAQQLVKAGCEVYREAQAFEQAQRMALLYGRLAAPRSVQALAGAIAEDWAKTKRQQLRRLGAAEAVRREPVDVWPRFREAGAAYAATAEASPGEPDQAQWWKRAADCYLEGGDFANAIGVLNGLVNTPAASELLGEAWFKLAEAHRAKHQDRAAELALQSCISYPGPFAYRARYQLALLDLERGLLDEAEATLKQNLELMAQMPDREAQEQSLYTLAKLLFQRERFTQAEPRLEQALRLNPEHPEALAARFRLGECYRHLAGLEPTRPSHPKRQREWLESAMGEYSQVVVALKARQTASPLVEADAILLRQALFAAAECHDNMGEYLQACSLYGTVLATNPPLAERLFVLKKLWGCYHLDGKLEEAAQVLDQFESFLSSADEAAFGGPSWVSRREELQKWLKAVRGPGSGIKDRGSVLGPLILDP